MQMSGREIRQRNKRRLFWLAILTILALSFLISALFITFFSSSVAQMRGEQIRLLQQNRILQKEIEEKKAFYESIRDRISEAQEEIGEKGAVGPQKGLKNLLKRLGTNERKLILDALPHGYPSLANRVTSVFGYRIHPILHQKRFHRGIDFAGAVGTPIVATADGIVKMAEFNNEGYGNVVKIMHNFGFETIYGHMLDDLKVSKGEYVKRGTVIGYLGNTGLSTGPHLHYEIKYLGLAIDPKPFLRWNLRRFDSLFQFQSRIYWRPLIAAILDSFSRSGALHLKRENSS